MGTAILAVSGGPDSVALLALLHALAEDLRLNLVVGHADHGIHPDSARVADLVATLARRYDVPVHVGRLELGPHASETQARTARYRWLRSIQRETGARYLVTAHHRDDQIETILLRALKGSGIAGLAGMSARGPRGLRRPLLPFSRATLRAYAEEQGLPFHDDPANRDPRHLRSWLRHTVLPVLAERMGDEVESNLLRLGRHAARARAAWDRVVDALPDLDVRPVPGGIEVARRPLAAYDKVLSVAVLRAVARRVGCRMTYHAAERVLATAGGPSGRHVEVPGGWAADVAFERLRLIRVGAAEGGTAAPAAPHAALGARGETEWGRRWRLVWRVDTAPDGIGRRGWSTWVPLGVPLEWRAPRQGDRLRPLGGVGRRSVARLLMEAKVSRPDRDNYPLLASGEEVLWIPGVCRADRALPAPGDRAVRIDANCDRVSPADRRA